jgi:hypothetical protein
MQTLIESALLFLFYLFQSTTLSNKSNIFLSTLFSFPHFYFQSYFYLFKLAKICLSKISFLLKILSCLGSALLNRLFHNIELFVVPWNCPWNTETFYKYSSTNGTSSIRSGIFQCSGTVCSKGHSLLLLQEALT